MNVSFLFGAGISLKAGLPKTSEITEQVLSGKNIARDQELRYLIDYPIDWDYK